MGKTFSTGNLTNGISQDTSNNIGIGGAPSGSYKFEVTGTGKLSGQLTLGSTITNGTYTYTLPGATGTLALTSDIPSLSATAPISYSGGVISISQATTSTNGYLSSTDWNTFNGKQSQINGTGFVKASGTTISYDNSTYLTTSAASSTYLPLSGGTLTGALNGTSAVFSSSVTAVTNMTITGASTSIAPQLLLNQTGGNTFGVIGINRADGSGIATGIGSALVLRSGDATDYPIQFATANNVRMTIATSGNVGIGTTSPSSLLHLNASTVTLRLSGGGYGASYNTLLSSVSGAIGVLQLGNNGDNYIVGGNSVAGGYLVFKVNATSETYTSGIEAMRITSVGNVLIGTTSASGEKLQVSGGAYVTQYLGFGVSAEDKYIGQGNQISGAFQGYDLAIANYASSGRVPIITSTGTGVYLGNGATSWATWSDERLKNINSNIENAVDKLSNIRAVNYSWKSDDTNKEYLGLIAQDIEIVFPQVIDKSKSFKKGDDTEYLSVRYTELIPVLVKAIQEQNQLIENLEARLKTLENK